MRTSEATGSAEPLMLSATIELPTGAQASHPGGHRPAHDHSSSSARLVMPRLVPVEDLSPGGFRFRSPVAVPIGSKIRLDLPGGGTATATVVAHDGDAHRCTFDVPLTQRQLDATLATADRVTDPTASGSGGKWPRSARAAIFIGGGVAAWAAAIVLLKALG